MVSSRTTKDESRHIHVSGQWLRMIPVLFVVFAAVAMTVMVAQRSLPTPYAAVGGRAADVSVVKEVDVDGDGDFNDAGQIVSPGDELTYRLTLSNVGDVAASSVAVSDDIPEGTTYVAGSTEHDATPVADSGGSSALVVGQGLDVGRLGTADLSPDAVYSPNGLEREVAAAGVTRTLTNAASVTNIGAGLYVAVWLNSDTSVYEGKIFDTDPLTPDTDLTISTGASVSPINAPSVAALLNGRFVVTWTATNALSRPAVFYRRYDSAGIAQDATEVEIAQCRVINPFTSSSCVQAGRNVSADADGVFYIAWGHAQTKFTFPASSSNTVLRAMFQDSGDTSAATEIGEALTLNGTASTNIVLDARAGKFSAVWHDGDVIEAEGTQGDTTGTFELAYSVDAGAPYSPPSTYFDIARNADESARYVFTRSESGGCDNPEHAVVMHRDSSGAIVGSPITLETNGFASGCVWAQTPAIRPLPDDGFVAAWSQYDNETEAGEQDLTDVYLRTYSSSNATASSAVKVSQVASTADVYPSVAVDPINNQVLVLNQHWDETYADISLSSALYDLPDPDGTTITYKVTVDAGQAGTISNQATVTATGLTAQSNTVTNPIAGSAASDSLTRIDAQDPISLALAVSQYRFANGTADAAIIATDETIVDALVATVLAARTNATLLLTDPTEVAQSVIDELKRALGGDFASKTIYIAGGTAALPAGIADALAAEGFTVQQRFAGADRDETARLIADEVARLNPQPLSRVLISENRAFADTLGAGSALPDAQGNYHPILLTERAALSLSGVTRAFLQEHTTITEVVVLGGTLAVDAEVAAELQEVLPGAQVARHEGANRFGTNVAFNTAVFGANPATVVVAAGDATQLPGAISTRSASGAGFFSALLAGTVGSDQAAPTVLVSATSVPTEISAYLMDRAGSITDVIVVGGVGSVSEAVAAELQQTVL